MVEFGADFLRDILVQTTFASNRSLAVPPSVIQLGVFGDENRSILATMPAGAHTSLGLTFVGADYRVLIWNQRLSFSASSGALTPIDLTDLLEPIQGIDPASLPKLFRQERHLAMLSLGSRTGLFPLGPLASLLLDDSYLGAASAVTHFIQGQVEVFFRSLASPNLSREEMIKKIFLWGNNFFSRVAEFTTSDMSEEEKAAIKLRVRSSLTA